MNKGWRDATKEETRRAGFALFAAACYQDRPFICGGREWLVCASPPIQFLRSVITYEIVPARIPVFPAK